MKTISTKTFYYVAAILAALTFVVVPAMTLFAGHGATYDISGSATVSGTVATVGGTAFVDDHGAKENTIHVAVDWNEDQSGSPDIDDAEVLPDSLVSATCTNKTECDITWGDIDHDYISAGAGTYVAYAIVYHGNLPGNDGLGSDSVAEIVIEIQTEPAEADLAVNKTVNDVNPTEGDVIKYSLDVINNGPDAANNVEVTDSLPSEVTFDSASTTLGTPSHDSGTVTWNIDSLANGVQAFLDIFVTINEGTGGSTFTNTASVSGDEDDPTSGNDSDSSSEVAVQNEPVLGDLIVKKVIEGGEKATSTFSFTINGGDSIFFDESGENTFSTSTDDTYTIVEDNPGGNYEVTHDNCDGLSLTAEATTTCTITNTFVPTPTATGTIQVTKKVPGGDTTEQLFEFNASWADDNFALYHNESTSTVQTVGNYSVSEIVPEGWSQDSAVCYYQNDATSTPANITVSEDETVTCIFKNSEEEGSEEEPADITGDIFSLSNSTTTDGQTFTQGQTVNVSTGVENLVNDDEVTLRLVADGSRPGDSGQVGGEVVCEDLFGAADCNTIMDLLSATTTQASGTFTPVNNIPVTIAPDAPAGEWNIRYFLVTDKELAVPPFDTHAQATFTFTVEAAPEESVPACADEIDNDEDGKTDLEDPGCENAEDNDESDDPTNGGGGDTGGEDNNNNNNDEPENTGGGGGNGPIAGSFGQSAPGAGVVLGASTSGDSEADEEPEGEVLGASTSCQALINTYIRRGRNNNEADVRALQQFLNEEVDANLPITGFYGPLTEAAVNAFQLKYADEVLAPWVPHGLESKRTPTGYVYKTTKRWVNMRHCADLDLPVPQLP